jgi:hypothetical protein
VDRDPGKASSKTGIFAQDRSGLVVLLAFVAVLLSVVWIVKAQHATIPEGLGMTLFCLPLGWAYLSMWSVFRRCRKLGWTRSNYTQFLSDPRSNDADELFIWRWTWQLCYAVLAVVLSVLALAFTS